MKRFIKVGVMIVEGKEAKKELELRLLQNENHFIERVLL